VSDPAGTNDVCVGAPKCTADELLHSSLNGAYYWTCDLNGDGGRFICDSNGNKASEACARGCVGQPAGTDDICAGPPTCSATEQSHSFYNGAYYWTCDLGGAATRYVCDEDGYKATEACASACVSQPTGVDDRCQ
jgi:hypothetical protein